MLDFQLDSNIEKFLPKTQLNIYVADSSPALQEHYRRPLALDSALLSASAGGKYFLLEIAHQKKMTEREKRTIQLYLEQQLCYQLESRGIPKDEIEKIAFSDSQTLPDYIRFKYPELIEK